MQHGIIMAPSTDAINTYIILCKSKGDISDFNLTKKKENNNLQIIREKKIEEKFTSVKVSTDY